MARKKEFSLENKLAELRTLLDKMQKPNVTFDENVDLFKKGSALILECRAYLDESELMIKQLTEGENGPEEADFE